MLIDFSNASLYLIAGVFLASAIAIAYCGTKLAHIADKLADRTGMGEIIAGALFVGASTSLPGIITSVTTASQGYAQLAIGNALGGLTAQTAFLAIADITYRKGNLEHAAASVLGLSQAVLLLTMLAIPLLAMSGPQFLIFHIHPASILLFIMYAVGLKLLREIQAEPLWKPVQTSLTQNEAEQAEAVGTDERSDRKLWLHFLLFAGATAMAGFMVGETSIAFVKQTGLSETAVGSVFTAVANSLPELVTAIVAVRIGAVNLAVGGVIGGNAFEVLFLAAADFFYTDGSLYAQFSSSNIFTAALVILMTGVLLLGMLNRQRKGFANIGWESALVLVLYAGSVIFLFWGGA